MIKKITKRIIISGLATAAVVALFLNFNFNNNTNPKSNDKSSSQKSSMQFTELPLSDDNLISKSDVIIKGKVTSIKEREVKTVKGVKTANGDETTVVAPYIVYNIEVQEDLKNTYDKKNIDVALIDSGEELLNEGKEYVLFLYKSPNKEFNYYSLYSYNYGVYQYEQDKSDIKEIKNDKKFNYLELKDKIKNINK